jgi:tellurite resistance protein
MNPDFLIRGVLGSVLGGGRKKSHRALRYLTGSGGSFFTRPQTLLTAAGVAWGIFETLQQQEGTPPGRSGLQGGGQWGGGAAPAGAQAAVAGSLPPLPGSTALPGNGAAPGVDAEALRLVQLAISAANADGVMGDKERGAVLQQAQSAGVGDVVERELNHRRPLAEIVAGVADQAQSATLYVLAFTVLRADEQVTGAERIYLAQLAHLLNLDPATVQQLEKDTAERIDSQGQP